VGRWAGGQVAAAGHRTDEQEQRRGEHPGRPDPHCRAQLTSNALASSTVAGTTGAAIIVAEVPRWLIVSPRAAGSPGSSVASRSGERLDLDDDGLGAGGGRCPAIALDDGEELRIERRPGHAVMGVVIGLILLAAMVGTTLETRWVRSRPASPLGLRESFAIARGNRTFSLLLAT
jgi:hypothetical protein